MPYMQQLIEGYRRFRQNNWARERERWAELAEGQSPQVMVLACADSRSDPSEIFDARGEGAESRRPLTGRRPPWAAGS